MFKNYVFDEFFNDVFSNINNTYTLQRNGVVDYEINQNVCIYEFKIPGVEKQDIKIENVNNIIYVEYKYKEEVSKYNLKVPNGYDEKNINAEYKNGILKITLLKKDQNIDKKQIEIK